MTMTLEKVIRFLGQTVIIGGYSSEFCVCGDNKGYHLEMSRYKHKHDARGIFIEEEHEDLSFYDIVLSNIPDFTLFTLVIKCRGYLFNFEMLKLEDHVVGGCEEVELVEDKTIFSVEIKEM